MNSKEYLTPRIRKAIRVESARPLCVSISTTGIEGISTGGGEYYDDDFANY